MFVLVFRDARTEIDRHAALGSDAGCDVVVDAAGVAPLHARVVVARGKLTLEPVEPVAVNRIATTMPVALRHGDEIGLGEATLLVDAGTGDARFAPAPLAPHERGLLEAIGGRDESSRLVYADWLEERGDTARAEFLRIQHRLPSGMAFGELGDRLRELARATDVGWRARVARAPIENCATLPDFAYRCPREWGSLDSTGQIDVRYCTACEQHVYYCATLDEARDHARRGECIAIDVANRRSPGDLAHEVAMGKPVPPRQP